MKRITLLGASGSIGLQTVEIIEEFSQSFKLVALSARRNVDAVKKILKNHPVKFVAMEKSFEADVLAMDPSVTFFPLEEDGLVRLINASTDSIVLNALVGSVGLISTLTAIKNNQDVLLANKESLVVGGPLIKEALLHSNSNLIPVDSEHAALKECLKDRSIESVEKMVITASGGSFRDYEREALKHVTKDDALKHPNWSMGQKITIDSATMMNKVFEVIEAHYLFGVSYDKIEAIIHKESLLHGMIHFKDGNVLAHFGPSDMKIPILSALQGEKTFRYRSLFDLSVQKALHFEPIDLKQYPLFDLGLAVAKEKGMHVVTLNASNEIAVERFLNDEIGFLDIESVIKKCLDHFDNHVPLTLDNILKHDEAVRDFARSLEI